MSIRFSCEQCQSVLQVGDELAGRQAKCPKCDARFRIPSSADHTASQSDIALSEATPEQMLQEFERRGQPAVLILLGEEEPSLHDLDDFSPTPTRTLATNNLTEDAWNQAMACLPADALPPRPSTDSTCLQQSEPFQLKGDALGMDLSDFRRKYARRLGDDEQGLPLCSGAGQGQLNSTLLTEEWHASAGIVHARIDLPVENNSPSVAGVKTDLVLFQFVDEKLFRITAFLNTDSFHVVCDALSGKYGVPTNQSDEPRQLTWENLSSYIELTRGKIRPKQASLLHFVHKQLLDVADQRKPTRGDDL